jgi:hypothetical protein
MLLRYRQAMLEERVGELKAIIARNDGRNAADIRFARAVDELISSFYDDISHVTDVSARAVFDLFVIKVLYVGRRSCHADVIDYLASLLETFLYARTLFPSDAGDRPRPVYASEALDEERRADTGETAFEAYRGYADRALFLTGVFHAQASRRRPPQRTVLRRRAAPTVDAAYYVSTGRTMYGLASRQEEAMDQRETLVRLARFFDVYAEALNEMSARYILGFDLDLIADKMLDSINAYRASRDEHALAEARGYATILQLEPARYPALFSESA